MTKASKKDKGKLNISQQVYQEVTGREISELKGSILDNDVETCRFLMSSPIRAALSTSDYLKNQLGELDFTSLVREINRQAEEVAGSDDMMLCQKMLAGQAIALDTVAHSLLHRAANQEYLSQYETYLKLALKAQAQSRCTMETISKIKNPPNATFVKQANISHGHQQVNNGSQTNPDNFDSNTRSRTRAEKTEKERNELLPEGTDNDLDARA